jgi:hypothetical protein
VFAVAVAVVGADMARARRPARRLAPQARRASARPAGGRRRPPRSRAGTAVTVGAGVVAASGGGGGGGGPALPARLPRRRRRRPTSDPARARNARSVVSRSAARPGPARRSVRAPTRSAPRARRSARVSRSPSRPSVGHGKFKSKAQHRMFFANPRLRGYARKWAVRGRYRFLPERVGLPTGRTAR